MLVHVSARPRSIWQMKCSTSDANLPQEGILYQQRTFEHRRTQWRTNVYCNVQYSTFISYQWPYLKFDKSVTHLLHSSIRKRTSNISTTGIHHRVAHMNDDDDDDDDGHF